MTAVLHGNANNNEVLLFIFLFIYLLYCSVKRQLSVGLIWFSVSDWLVVTEKRGRQGETVKHGRNKNVLFGMIYGLNYSRKEKGGQDETVFKILVRSMTGIGQHLMRCPN